MVLFVAIPTTITTTITTTEAPSQERCEGLATSRVDLVQKSVNKSSICHLAGVEHKEVRLRCWAQAPVSVVPAHNNMRVRRLALKSPPLINQNIGSTTACT